MSVYGLGADAEFVGRLEALLGRMADLDGRNGARRISGATASGSYLEKRTA